MKELLDHPDPAQIGVLLQGLPCSFSQTNNIDGHFLNKVGGIISVVGNVGDNIEGIIVGHVRGNIQDNV